MSQPEKTDAALELRRWERECEFRSREIAVKEYELQLRQKEITTSRWNPLVIAIMVATLAAAGNIFVAYWNGEQQRNAELRNAETQRRLSLARAEESRVLAMLHATSTDQAAENLSFLLEAGLITDEVLVGRVKAFLSKRAPKTGPQLAGAYDGGFDVFEIGRDSRPVYLGNTFRNPSIDTVETISKPKVK